jgi:biopolymer transport protein ExbD
MGPVGGEPGIASRLIRLAARNAPADLVTRLEEEWLADLAALDGTVDRWRHALGCCQAALLIRHEHRPRKSAPVDSSTGVMVMSAHAQAYRGASRFPVHRPKASPGLAICEINTTPLIDVLLVLLVTLILTLPIMTHAVKLDLPHGPPPSIVDLPPSIDLEIDFDGTVVWNGTVVPSFGQLETYFGTEARKVPQAEIHLRADRRAKYDFVARVLASAQRHGMKRIGFVDTGSFSD